MAEHLYENTGFLITTKSIQAEIAQLQNALASVSVAWSETHSLARRVGILGRFSSAGRLTRSVRDKILAKNDSFDTMCQPPGSVAFEKLVLPVIVPND